jgi:hypothetical protein
MATDLVLGQRASTLFRGYSPGQLMLALAIGALLVVFLVVPVATVVYVAFAEPGSGLTL